ncbi:Serine hydrolase-like protein [Elsinoe australis]|uniref:Serine hydrolase-like protein n=1 Tax=Elsinoe australis TaxID=40998 RepID=A0A2P7YE26_9PEZI|nr:Serine hydrolase-like protein [Elsinoe australis]
METVNSLWDSEGFRRALPLGLAFLALYQILGPNKSSNWSEPPVIKSPLEEVERLSSTAKNDLPYPPDALPGARDVSSPYGTIRVYEWGPSSGSKVLLIHGISTPCISLAGVAKNLVDRGYRVMLFDLFGRGFSSSPDPLTNPQNIQLFTTQILLALASSPLSWTGEHKFRLVGYSLGGGIAASFTSYFPDLVESLVIIAPSGLLRASRIHWTSRLIYGGLIPRSLVHFLVGRRLGGGFTPAGSHSKSGNPETTPGRVIEAEMPDEEEKRDHPALMPDSQASLFEDRPGISVADAVKWQLENHQGFLSAFVSSIQHAPISEQQGRWEVVKANKNKLRGGKVLMVLGSDDGVIVKDEVEQDARGVLGDDGLEVQLIEAGHDLPIVKPVEVVQHILTFWKD